MTRDLLPAGFNSIHHHSLSSALQPVLTQIILKIFMYSKLIIIASFYITISQFINKIRGLFFGGSINHS